MLDNMKLIDAIMKNLGIAATDLPKDVVESLSRAYASETEDIAAGQLHAILENVELAKSESLPLCQDTGIQMFFIKAGYDFPYLSQVHKAIPEAIVRTTESIPLRPNTMDPFTHKNSGNNMGHNMPVITVELVEGDSAEIYVLPKGGGSENMSALWMLTPAQGFKEAKKKILQQVQYAGGKPCPPIVLGIGFGGGADVSMKLAKKAILRPIGQSSPIKEVAAMEAELLEAINKLGVGPMGMGGQTTALAVNIEYTCRHPATFPVAMVVQCWCDRRAPIHIDKNGVIR